MITKSSRSGIERLSIFSPFQKDMSLPKFKVAESKTSWKSNDGIFISNFSTGELAISGSGFPDTPPKPDSFLKKLMDKFKSKTTRTFENWNSTSVENTFHDIMNDLSKLENLKEKIKSYKESIEYCKVTGQKSLEEELVNNIPVFEKEVQLVSAGYDQCITDIQLIKFYKQCERGLRLDYIKNFTRVIPKDVINKKIECDKLFLFDNYAILHFDPESKSYKMTKSEIAKKEDPILFGLIENSNKLYFVGDWKDKYCDLTFEKFIEKFGTENLKLEV